MEDFLVGGVKQFHDDAKCISKSAHSSLQKVHNAAQEEMSGAVPERGNAEGVGQHTPVSEILPGSKPSSPDVIVIDDDNEDVSDGEFSDDDGDGSSDATSSKFRHLYDSRDDWHSTGNSLELSESSDEEDCIVMEPGPSRRRPPKHGRRKALSCSSSECEIVEDEDGKVRQEWEEAAFRRRMGSTFYNSRYAAESEGSTSASNYASSTVKKREPHSQQQDQEPPCSGSSISMAQTASKKRKEPPVCFEDQDSTSDCPNDMGEGEEILVRTFSGGNISHSSGPSSLRTEEAQSPVLHTTLDIDAESSSLLEGYGNPEEIAREIETHVEQGEATAAVDCKEKMTVDEDDIARVKGDQVKHRGAAEAAEGRTVVYINREMLKETAEFRNADAEEWARRQLELQRQAQEAQRERKRRRLEAERRMEMESRQKQRLEEIRKSQQREEENLGYKEHVRERIQSELESIAASCKDMATLLRRLGIPVDGGPFPSRQQVNTAYKKALLRFHPDRVAAMAKSDPLHQVEAEETFKLISRMKHTL